MKPGQKGDRLGFSYEITGRSARKILREHLLSEGCEVNSEQAGYRIMMFRRDENSWSHVHVCRHGYRISGPEKQIALSIGSIISRKERQNG